MSCALQMEKGKMLYDINQQAAHLHNELLAAGVDIFDVKNQQRMYRVFTTLSMDQLTYGTTITYLLQQIHGHHFPETDARGYCFTQDDGETICPFAIAPRPLDGSLSVVITSPRGAKVPETIKALKNIISEIDETVNIYVKNTPPNLASSLKGYCKDDVMPWNALAPFEDDTYPNINVDVALLMAEVSISSEGLRTNSGKPFVKVKQKLRGLATKLAVDELLISDFTLTPYNPATDWDGAERIIARFFGEKDTRGHLSKPVDYYNIFATPVTWRDEADYVRAFLSFKGERLGLVAAERIGGPDSQSFGVYSMLITKPAPDLLRAEIINISELQTMLLMQEISQRGGKFADLGGAETAALQQHHLKYIPERKDKLELKPVQAAPWLELSL